MFGVTDDASGDGACLDFRGGIEGAGDKIICTRSCRCCSSTLSFNGVQQVLFVGVSRDFQSCLDGSCVWGLPLIVDGEEMPQSPKGCLYGPRSKRHLGGCAIYSEATVLVLDVPSNSMSDICLRATFWHPKAGVTLLGMIMEVAKWPDDDDHFPVQTGAFPLS